jgi:hypothetical protein
LITPGIEFEDWVCNQDASFGLAINLIKYQQTERRGILQPTIRFSNFGNLVTFTWGDLLPEDFKIIIIETLKKYEFNYVVCEELDCPYDGVMQEHDFLNTWFTRYFDWL